MNVNVLDSQLYVVAKLVQENVDLRSEIDRLNKENSQLYARLTKQEGAPEA